VTAPRLKGVDPGASGAKVPPDPGFSVRYMEADVGPATDFYRYANGTWLRENPVPSDKARWGAFDELLQRNFETIRQILEESTAAPRLPGDAVRGQIGALFASAMDFGRRDALGFAPIAPELERLARLGSVPEIVEAVAHLHDDGVDPWFDTYSYPDKRASGIYGFYLEQGGLSLPDREYYLGERFAGLREAYRAHVTRSFRAVGEEADAAARSTESVVRLETELARASRTPAERRDQERNYHRTTVAELAGRHRTLDWERYFRVRGLAEVPYVIVGQPEFHDALDRLLLERPLEAWRAYLRWTVLRDSAPFLHRAAEAEHFDFFRRTLLGQQEPEPDWKRAALVIDGLLGEALGQLYVERAFPAEARARMATLVDDLRAVFRDRLGALPWMSDETRARALEKFARFAAKIGHPDRYRDYSSVRIDAGDYLGNVRRARAFEVRRQTVRVAQPVDPDEWGMTPPTVNAYFSPVRNEIVFPAGILQPPFFDVRQDDAVNYGGIGAVIGHEITHGYDDQGRKFDPKGNLADWWTAADAREFERRARRVVEEYSRYEPLPGMAINGELTLGENLADLGGLSIAFEALQRRLRAEPSRRRTVDGLTPEQRFFLSWAQIWRQNVSEAELRRRLVTDPHAPGRFRALGGALNHDAFFEAFAVGEQAPMWRPKADRTTVW
jgi:putative endopeptidase